MGGRKRKAGWSWKEEEEEAGIKTGNQEEMRNQNKRFPFSALALILISVSVSVWKIFHFRVSGQFTFRTGRFALWRRWGSGMRRHIGSLAGLSVFDTVTAHKLAGLLEKGGTGAEKVRKLIAGGKLQHEQHTNEVTKILDYTYHQHNSKDNAYPLWMSKFVYARSGTKAEKIELVNQYAPMLTLRHTIQKVDEEPNKKGHQTLLDKYMAKWNYEQLEFCQKLQYMDPNSLFDMKVKENQKYFFQLKFEQNMRLSPDISKLIKIRQQYSSVLKYKFKPPELTIIINPDRFGEPPVPERVFNMRLRRLIKLQKYYLKYPPISHKDMREFNELDLNSLSGTVREAYVEFLTNAAFVINDEGQVEKSNILAKRLSLSEKVQALYKEFL